MTLGVNTSQLLATARAAEASGQIGRVAQICGQILYLDPSCAAALEMMGGVALQQGRTSEGESMLRQATSLNPDSYDASRWLATLLIGRDGGTEAVEFGRAAVRIKPKSADSHVALALASLGKGDNARAIESFQKAIELSPKMAGAYHNLGVAFQREEDFDEAIEAFEKAAQLAPDLAETYLHLGKAYLAKDRGDEALACAEKASSLKPNSRMALRLIADAGAEAVRGENAEIHLRKLMERHPDSGLPYSLLASRLQEQGDFDAAEESLRKSLELEPLQGHAYYSLAHNRKMREEDRPLANEMERVVMSPKLDRNERRFAHFALGKLYDDLGEYEKAIQNFDLAHEEDSGQSSTAEPKQNRAQRFIQLLSAEYLDSFAGKTLDSEIPIFIFGMPRSGTTLLEQVISRHSTVGGGGELFFWRDSTRKIVNFAEGKLRADELRKAGEKYLREIAALAPGKAHVTDKFPSNYVYLGMLRLIFPNAKFIHARRHPIDTCLSIYMRPFTVTQGLGQSRRKIVETYKQYRRSMAHWRSVLPSGSFLDVDYEQMVQSPEETIRRVIDHCGLSWEDACLRPEEGERRVVTFSKWQVRQPVYTTSMERWRRYEPWLGEFRELLEDL